MKEERRVRKRRGKMDWRKISAAVVATMLVVALVIGLVPKDTARVLAADTIADLDTSTKYTESLGDNASTEFAGRIWTDKSVYDEDVSFELYAPEGEEHQTETITLGDDEDFLITYSALATSQEIRGNVETPLDVVFVIDMSGSMGTSMNNRQNRLYNAAVALNNAMKDLLALNDYVRVGVIGFNSTAYTLLPLEHYEQVSGREFVTCSGTTLTINASGTTTTRTNYNIDSSSGTNIQKGIFEGMNMLATESSTSVNMNGTNVKRVPSLILLSDGQPSSASDYRTWWDISADTARMTPVGTRSVYGMKALMTASYMKKAIDRNYGGTGATAATVYSIGVGIGDLSTDDRALAYATINPNDSTLRTSRNDLVTTIQSAWNDYANGRTSEVNGYTFNHPTGDDIIPEDKDIDGLYYVNEYRDADDAQAIIDVFDSFVTSISVKAAEAPTKITGTDPLTDGYITYTDKIGQYMTVKDVKEIIYAGQIFKQKTKSTTDGVTKYTFEGNVDSPVFGKQDIKNIVITVSADKDGNETLKVEIPAAVIPIRVNTVELNANGSVKSHTNNGAYPTRVIYSVSVKDDVLTTSNGVQIVDTSKLSEEYLAANTNEDGTVNFYSNLYTGTNVVDDMTAGDTIVEFEPAHTNPFYYIQEDTPIYTKNASGEYVFADANTPISDTETYYYYEEYYHGTSVEQQYVERTGAQLERTVIINKNGNWYRAAGSPRINKILKFEGTKTQNATNTAQVFYGPTFQYAAGSTDAYAGKFAIYLGNNGVLSIASTGNLEISKEVVVPEGLSPSTNEFEFTVNFNGNATLTGTYPYVVVNADGTIASEGVVADGGVVTLRDGQKATIKYLPDGTTYEVTEAEAAGFTTETDGNTTGLIEAGQTSSEVFTNTYRIVEPLTFPAEGGLEGKKVLSGRPYDADVDTYTFFLTPYNNAPLPKGYNAEKGVSVTLSSSNEAEFDFGSVEFEQPGIYRYTIVEKEPENDAYLPGMSYSRALYNVVVTVEDNGDGTLRADGEIQKLYTDAADPLFTYDANNEIVMNAGQEAEDEVVFTNTYSADDVTRTPVALKTYIDNSGQKPLVSGMFKFALSPVGVVQGNDVVPNTANDVPMPLDGEGNRLARVETENEGHNITFLPVIFKQSDIPAGQATITFRYMMNEVVPTGNDVVPGMIYDENEYFIDVVVSIDSNSDALIVNANFPNGERILSFVNTYTPEPVSTEITGTKTLNGRDMLEGEEFEFTLTAANEVTEEVLEAAKTTTVSNGKDGVASEFSFGDIEFTKPGTYVFHVTETKGNAGGVAYDTHTAVVTIEVIDNNGSLEIANSTTIAKAEFVNTYTSKFTGTGVSLSGAKHLTGKSLLAGEFYFVVKDDTNGTEQVVTHAVDEEHENGVYHGNIQFLKDVTYTKAGTYVYEISEQIPEIKVVGTTYDESIYRYTVTVSDDWAGNLSVTDTKLEISEDKGQTWNTVTDDIIFENTYEPNPLPFKVSPMHKVLEGNREAEIGEGEFTFTLSLVSANPIDGITLPTITTVGNVENGFVNFGDITFTKAGTYTVKVTEEIPTEAILNADGIYTLNGVTYTAKPIEATYEVTDDRNGTLTARIISSSGTRTFTNVYESEGTLQLQISKEFIGREGDQWLDTDKFEFEVVILDPTTQAAVDAGEVVFPSDGDGIQKLVIDKKDEIVTSPEVTIKKSGTYKFIVREVTTNPIPGVIYDSTRREIVVTAKDQSNGSIKVDYTITDNLTLTFKNVYDEGSTELSGHDNLWVIKELTGRDWTDTDSFTFILAANNQATKDAVEAGIVELPNTTLEVSTANKAHAHFGNIVFQEADTYEFSITEQVPDEAQKVDGKFVKDGITYDDTPRIVTVAVEDNNEGQLVVTELSVTPEEKLTFTNTYEAKEVEIIGSETLEVTKVLNGRNWFADDEYIFTLEAIDETSDAVASGDVVYKGKTEIEITNESPKQEDANGESMEETRKGAFGNIVFTKAGTYTFVIQEKVGDIDNISYDRTAIFVTVTVTDNGKGQLESEVAYNVPSITFVNTYTPDPVTVAFKGTKVLNGDRTLEMGEFYFRIEGIDNAPLPSVRTIVNGANGYTSPIEFGSITYDKAGTYSYVISEIKGHLAGIEYDAKEVHVTVEVTYDEQTGKLKTATTYEKDGETSNEGFTFTNTYHKADISIVKEQEINGGTRTQTLETVRENDKVTYYLVVSNNGKGDASGVVVEDMIPTGLTLDSIHDGGSLGTDNRTITWNIGSLVAGATKTVSFTVVVPDVDVATTWKNVGTVEYYHPGKDTPEEKDSNEVEMNQGVPVVEVEKTQKLNNGSATKDKLTVREGDKVTYSITVKNAGTEVATGIVIEDKIPEGLTLANGSISDNGVEKNGTITWTINELAIGGEETVSFSVTVPDVETQTTWKNIATVDYTNDPEDPQDEEDPEPSNEVEIEEGVPNVSVEKFQSVNGQTATKDAQSVKAGDEVTYIIKVKNSGTEVAESIEIKDAIPTGLTLDSIHDGGSLGSDGVITWNTGDLAIGTEKEVSFTVTVPNTEEEFTIWTNIATVNHTNDPKDPDEPEKSNPVTVMDSVNAGLTGVKRMEGDRDTVTDKEFSFKIEAVTSDAPMPDATEVQNDENGIFAFGPITYAKEGQYTYKITEVHAGQTIKGVTYDDTVYYAVVTVEEVSNTTTAISYKVTDITYYKNSVNGEASATFTFVNTYYDADLAIAKTQSVNGGNAVATKLTVRENDKVTYYLTVTNNGKGQASNVTVTDEIPEGLVLVENSISDNGVEADGTITWNIDKLAAETSITVSFSVIVPDVKEDTAWKNVATVVYNNPDDDPQEENSNEVEVGEGTPRVTAEKLQSVNGGESGTNLLAVKKGDKVTYYIIIRNTGTEVASGIVVTDVLPKGLTLMEGSISNNGVMKDGVITWNLGELAADGTITVSFSVTVPEVDEKTTWKNIATVDYTNDPEDPTDPEPSNPVEIVEEPEEVHTVIPTSDNVNAMFYFILAAAAIATVMLSLDSKRRIR